MENEKLKEKQNDVKNNELNKVKDSYSTPDNSNCIGEYEKFRKTSNDAFKEYVKKCIKRQSWILGIYSFLCLLVVGACFCFWNCDMLIVIVAYMVLALAVMIILGIVISKCITATSSNLKADTDANRKLNEKIDEKVMGKMG